MSEFVDLYDRNRKFGCEECYDAFSPKIDSILKRIQGSNRYGAGCAGMHHC